MEINKTKYRNCTYISAVVTKPIMPFRLISGWVEAGGDPENVQGSWVATVIAERRKGILRYSIKEDLNYPGDSIEVDRAFTLSGASNKVCRRITNIAELVAKELDLPLVGYDEAKRQKAKADRIAVERLEAKHLSF